MKDARGFIVATLVKVPYEPRPLFFRVQEVDCTTNRLRLRLERFTLFWQTASAHIKAGMHVHIGSGVLLPASLTLRAPVPLDPDLCIPRLSAKLRVLWHPPALMSALLRCQCVWRGGLGGNGVISR